MEKPAIPTPGAGADKSLAPIKANIEILTGIRGTPIQPLGSGVSASDITNKVNEILGLLQGTAAPIIDPNGHSLTSTTPPAGDNSGNTATTAFVATSIATIAAVPPGMIGLFATAAGVAPTGWLICPQAASLVSTTTYAALFAAIGYTWGGSGGSFGLPWFPGSYTAITPSGAQNSGVSWAGQVISHTHAETYSTGAGSGGWAGSTAGTSPQVASGLVTQPAGGAANYAAGVVLQFCVKY